MERTSLPGEMVEMAGDDALGDRPGGQPAAYVLPTFPMGVRPGIAIDRAGHLASDLEDDETVRRLSD